MALTSRRENYDGTTNTSGMEATINLMSMNPEMFYY